MNFKRAVWISLLLYLASLVVGLLLALIIGIDEATALNPPVSMWIWGMVLTVILTGLFTLWYFKGIKGSWQDGLKLGGVMVGVGLVLDLTLVGLAGQMDSLLAYYANPLFFLTILLLLGAAMFVGKFKDKFSKSL